MRIFDTNRRTLSTISVCTLACLSLVFAGCDNSNATIEVVDASSTETVQATPVADEHSTEVVPAAPVGPDLVDGPRIVFDQAFHDFGVISDTLPVSFDFVFRNEGNEVLKMGTVRASCGCTAAAPSKDEYMPGEEGSIHVTFKPKGRTGHQAKSIRVETNDQTSRITNLRISSDVLSAVAIDPKVFRFEQVEAGNPKTIKGSIRIRGEGYEVTDINVLGEYVSAKMLETKTIDVAGSAATSTEIEVTIHDNAPLGWMDSKLLVRTSNPDRPNIEAPIWAEVLGPIQIQPAKLPLGVVRDGVPFRRELRLVSRAGELFKLTDWKIDCDYEGLEMNLEVANEMPEEGVAILRLIVTGTGPAKIGKLEGKIVLSTSLDKDRDINVPFHCIVRAVK